MKLAANLTMLFTELDPLDRVAAAAEAGFAGVEIQFPYDLDAQAFRDRLVWAEMPLVLFNGPPPAYAGGTPGWAATAGPRFARDFGRVLRYASVLKPQMLHIMAGPGGTQEAMVENLRHAAAAAPEQRLMIEPINRVDMPGYFLSNYDLAAQIIEAVGAPNLGLQFDAYHAHRITGNVSRTWDQVKSHVGHVQIAGFPGRHEPMDGEIDFPDFFERLSADGYDGWVSAEYHPAGKTTDGLGWLRAHC